MDQHAEHCPACGRAFAGVQDYPRVRVLSFERLPIPEAMDQISGAAAQRRHARRRIEPDTAGVPREGGINRTPEIARACDTAEVRVYFSNLEGLVGQEVAPDQLLPPLRAHGYFRWAYPVTGTGISLALEENVLGVGGERVAEVQVYCDGPNLGSAGGPTLQPLSAVARIRYRGLLAPAFPSGTTGTAS